MKVWKSPVIALLAAALAGPGFAGCSSDEEGAKADTAGPVTLRIGTDDEPGKHRYRLDPGGTPHVPTHATVPGRTRHRS